MFEIAWAKTASKNLRETLEFWMAHNHSAEYSKKIAAAVEKAEDILKNHPSAGTQTSYREVRRILVLRSFSIFYSVNYQKKTIKIVAFRDNHRKPKF